MKTTSDCDFGVYPLMTVVTTAKLSTATNKDEGFFQ